MKTYLFWDKQAPSDTPQGIQAEDRMAAMRFFEERVAAVMHETTEETRSFLKGNAQVRQFVEGSAKSLTYMGFRLAEVELKEYK